MNQLCEQVRLAAMAQADGETAPLALAEVQAHVAACAECQKTLAHLEATTRMLAGYRLSPQTVHLAASVQTAIAAAQSRRQARHFVWFFLALVLILLVERAIVLDSEALTRWLTRATACLLVAGWFLCQRENPFSVTERVQLSKPVSL